MTEKTEASEPAADKPAPAFALSISEFCTRLSLTDKRVELIGAFEHAQRVAGHAKDTEAVFARRFSAFAKKPA